MARRAPERLQDFGLGFAPLRRGRLPRGGLAVRRLRRGRVQQRRAGGKFLLISRKLRQLYRIEEVRALPTKEILVSQILLNAYSGKTVSTQ